MLSVAKKLMYGSRLEPTMHVIQRKQFSRISKANVLENLDEMFSRHQYQMVDWTYVTQQTPVTERLTHFPWITLYTV